MRALRHSKPRNIRGKTDMAYEYTVNEFCRAALSQMVEQGKHDIVFDDERTAVALNRLVSRVWDEAKRLYQEGDREKVATLTEWLDAIAPNPNTGSFDGFWQALRSLQPLDLGVKNPRYIRLDATLDPAYRRATLDSVPAEWKGLVQEAGFLLKQAA